MDGKLLEEQYVHFLSDYLIWDQREHAEEWMLFEENLGECISIDETALSQGELYTVITNKAAKGKKGALIALVKGTNSEDVRKVLERISPRKRNNVKEVTLDMAPTMERIAKYSFPKASLVTDRFHVQKLAYEAVQEMRIHYRWQALEQENKEIELGKETGMKYRPEVLDNGDTMKQLLARSRYLLFKAESKWTPTQRRRAELLFERYPDLERAYELAMHLGRVFHSTKDKGLGFTRLAQWYDKVEKAGFKSFNTVARSIQYHYLTILNYFDNRSTNASAESFNAKIKAFRSAFRGVRNISFFLFRLSNIYA
ncbi:transposase [Solitalea lacus]|uniref:ISAon1 family transposase n=1 Tax=Solitalea lacus TaxID=2911172 RepID=UPI001EDA3741|nr:transposase [Solitalea lacus]UKJ09142.1 transposase [Solitalea lacus]